MPDDRAALQIYDAWTDQELIDFVAARLPNMLWRVQKKPRCALTRELIFRELNQNPNGKRAMNLSEEF